MLFKFLFLKKKSFPIVASEHLPFLKGSAVIQKAPDTLSCLVSNPRFSKEVQISFFGGIPLRQIHPVLELRKKIMWISMPSSKKGADIISRSCSGAGYLWAALSSINDAKSVGLF